MYLYYNSYQIHVVNLEATMKTTKHKMAESKALQWRQNGILKMTQLSL